MADESNQQTVNIFLPTGRIDIGIDPNRIPPGRREAYSALVAATINVEQCESDQRTADNNLAERVRIHNEAVARVPRQSHVELVREAMGVAQGAVATEPAKIITEPHPYVAAKAAEQEVITARQTARECRDRTHQARVTFAKALDAWNRSGPVATPEQATRAWIKSNQEELARKAAEGTLYRRPTLNQTARAYSPGGHRAPGRGGGRAFARGAFTRAQALEAESQRLRTAAAAALKPKA